MVITGSESGTVNYPLHCKTVEVEDQRLCEHSFQDFLRRESEFVCLQYAGTSTHPPGPCGLDQTWHCSAVHGPDSHTKCYFTPEWANFLTGGTTIGSTMTHDRGTGTAAGFW